MIVLVLTAYFFSFGTGANAGGLFSYKDENGTLHAVESPDAVPEKYRKAAHSLSRDSNPRRISGDPCEGKQICATIFVAPWCEASLALADEYRNILAGNRKESKSAVRVVVGLESEPGSSEKFADTFGNGAIVDSSDEIAKKLNIGMVPAFFVMDDKGNTTMSYGDAAIWVRGEFARERYPASYFGYPRIIQAEPGACDVNDRPK